MKVLLRAEQRNGGGEFDVTVETSELVKGVFSLVGMEMGCLRRALWQNNGDFQLAVGNGFLGTFEERNPENEICTVLRSANKVVEVVIPASDKRVIPASEYGVTGLELKVGLAGV